MQNKLKLLDASVRHLGTDINYVVLENIYDELKNKVDFRFFMAVNHIEKLEKGGYVVCNGEKKVQRKLDVNQNYKIIIKF